MGEPKKNLFQRALDSILNKSKPDPKLKQVAETYRATQLKPPSLEEQWKTSIEANQAKSWSQALNWTKPDYTGYFPPGWNQKRYDEAAQNAEWNQQDRDFANLQANLSATGVPDTMVDTEVQYLENDVALTEALQEYYAKAKRGGLTKTQAHEKMRKERGTTDHSYTDVTLVNSAHERDPRRMNMSYEDAQAAGYYDKPGPGNDRGAPQRQAGEAQIARSNWDRTGAPAEGLGPGPVSVDPLILKAIGLPDASSQEQWRTPMRGDLRRQDGTVKGDGFMGTIKNANGDTMSELSVGGDPNYPEEGFYPLLGPWLHDDEITALQKGQPATKEMFQKARAAADERAKLGKAAFAPPGYSAGPIKPTK